jgi:hypothetical protein
MDLLERSMTDKPLILLGKGGGGTRLLSLMAQDCGVCIGNEVNTSGDCMDMEKAIKQTMTDKLQNPESFNRVRSIETLRLSAEKMLHEMRPDQRLSWGFKLPESLFILPELADAFPKARYGVIFKNPLHNSIRRTHLTSRLNTPEGKVTLPAAYEYAGIESSRIESDNFLLHNAYTTRHQLELLIGFLSHQEFPASRCFICKYEDIIRSPHEQLKAFSAWLGRPETGSGLADAVDVNRAKQVTEADDATREKVRSIVKQISEKLGYEI